MGASIPVEAVEAARRGGQSEVDRLIELAWTPAYRLAYAVLGVPSEAEDAAQEACVLVYRTIATLREPAAFDAWLYRIVIRQASTIKRRRTHSEPPPPPIDVHDAALSVDVWRALSALPPKLREVVVLRYFEDFSSREIAAVLQIPDGTVRFRLMIARKRLRPLLGDILEDSSLGAEEVRTHAI